MLADKGVQVTGVDVVPALIEAARERGGGAFHLLSYADLAAGALSERADVVVCNFSLLGEASVDDLLAAVPGMLEPEGVLLVQTMHPLAVGSAEPYRDGWRDGSWAGCGEGFGKPAPWYFRTFGGWLACLRAAGLQLTHIDDKGQGDEQASRRGFPRHRAGWSEPTGRCATVRSGQSVVHASASLVEMRARPSRARQPQWAELPGRRDRASRRVLAIA